MKTLLITILCISLALNCVNTSKKKSIEDYALSDEEVDSLIEAGAFQAYDSAPEIISQPDLVYPRGTLDGRYEAEVWVNTHIDDTGTPIEVRIEKVNGRKNIGFEEAATDQAWATKWKSAVMDGKSVDVWVTYKAMFSLRK